MCLPNQLSCMPPSTEIVVDECHLGSGVIREGGAEITRMNPYSWYACSYHNSGTETDPTILLLPMIVKCTLCHGSYDTKSTIQYVILTRMVTCSIILESGVGSQTCTWPTMFGSRCPQKMLLALLSLVDVTYHLHQLQVHSIQSNLVKFLRTLGCTGIFLKTMINHPFGNGLYHL